MTSDSIPTEIAPARISSPAYTSAVLDRLRSLGKSFTVYGLGDVATSIISFLLLPIYARFLSPADYGAIGLLTTIELVTKIVYRFGLDASFMRLYVDCPDDHARQRLASTLFWFLFVVDGSVLVPGLLAASLITQAIGVPGYEWALRILLLNTSSSASTSSRSTSCG